MRIEGLPVINRENNMGVVRYVLATFIVLHHFINLTGVVKWSMAGVVAPAVGGFFALSGFLAFRSFSSRQCNARAYILNRIHRLMPLYLLTVVGGAVALVALSTLSPTDYFTSGSFWRYIAANTLTLNFLAPTLPGVFDGLHHLTSAVDGALWTVKIDLLLTLSVPMVYMLFRATPKRRVPVMIAIIALSLLYRGVALWLWAITGNPLFGVAGRQVVGQFAYFYMGALLYFCFDSIVARHHIVLTAIAVVSLAASPWLLYSHVWLYPPAISLLVVTLSMWGKQFSTLSRNDNMPYAIYLVHFTLIQVAVSLGIGSLAPWLGFTLCMGASLAVAWLMCGLSKLFFR